MRLSLIIVTAVEQENERTHLMTVNSKRNVSLLINLLQNVTVSLKF